MRIKNNGKAVIYYNGGVLEPGRSVAFKDDAVKIGAALLSAYSFLEDLDNLEDDTESKSALVKKAKELGIRGNVEGMKEETLKAKIAEAESK